MFTFSVLLLPLAIGIFFTQNKNKANIILVITGFLTGIIVFALKEFLTLSHRVVPFSFGENFWYLFLREAVLPVAILYLVFFFISKDELSFKLEAFFPLIASYFVVFLPYQCITSPEAKTAFEAFFKPVLFFSMIWGISTCLYFIKDGINGNKALCALGGAGILVFLVLPALAETMFLMNFPAISFILLSVLALALASGAKFKQI